MPKRMGIFTFMLSNYGAVLQAYALQRYLRNVSQHEVEVIDFTTKTHLDSNKIFRRKSRNPLKNVILMMITLRYYFPLRKRRIRTDMFKRSCINFSNRYSTVEEIMANPPVKDVYISGSDQVFNLKNRFSDVYYLNFSKGNGKKVAYAPSFGCSSFDSNFADKIRSAILDFDALSCREQEGALFLSSITKTEVPVVVDPTMLLTEHQWKDVAIKPDYNDYICVYDLNGGEKLITIAKKIRSLTGYKIVCITENVRQNYDVDKIVFDAGPAEFVGWIANSNYVVTDSFHGTSFAIIFKKPFNTYIATPKSSSRIYTLLVKLGLSNRVVKYGEHDLFKPQSDLLIFPNIDMAQLTIASKEYIYKEII